MSMRRLVIWLTCCGVLALPTGTPAAVLAQTNASGTGVAGPGAGSGFGAGAWHTARLNAASHDSADGGAVLEAAARELVLNRPDRARAIVSSADGLATAYPVRFRIIMGALEYEASAFERAATLFREAADLQEGQDRLVSVARAGDAFELAGLPESAAEQYRLAATLSPSAAPWFRFREARVVPDTAAVSRLLEGVPAELSQQALLLWADRLLAAGDTLPAVSAYLVAGRQGPAALLSLRTGDTAEAVRLAYLAIASSDTASVRVGLRVATTASAPATVEELMDVARAYEKLGDTRVALQFAERALRGDSVPPEAYEYAGDLLNRRRLRDRALAMYASAIERYEPADAESAAYKRARLLFRVNRTAGTRALRDFATTYPGNRNAALAMYLAGDAARDRGRHDEADSLFGVVAALWPRDTYASRARFEMAARHLQRGDTAGAEAFYQHESRAGGVSRRAAEYFLADLAAARGDSLEARGMWAALTRADSLGYYGTIAREVAGLQPMRIDPAPPTKPTARALETLQLVDLFQAAEYDAEVEAIVDAIQANDTGSPHEWLDLAEGLIERGRPVIGVRLGWRAARALTLNHPRVLRAIFPWPLREAIEEEAREFGVDPYIIAGLIRQESAFRVAVVSHAGAHGLMQLMPPTARAVARRLGVEWDRSLLHVADANMHLGVSHFAALLDRYDGDVLPSLAAYNAGSTPVRRWLRYPEANDPVRWVERVPYRETRGYLQTVIRNRALYRALYPPHEPGADGTR